MKGFIVVSLMLLSFHALANETAKILKDFKEECKTTEVVVDEIVRDSHIRGHIEGMKEEAYDRFKVVFYVKTNRWYVHPYTYYEGQQEGYSYSNINRNGEFYVRTVRRQVPSKQLAVVLVPRSYVIAPQKFWLRPVFGFLGGVLKNQCSHTIVEGNGDFFH